MKAVFVPLAAFVAFTVPAVAVAQQGDQTKIVQTPAITVDPSTVRRDDTLTFDLDDTAATSAPLPEGTRDYEEAEPMDIETMVDVDFAL